MPEKFVAQVLLNVHWKNVVGQVELDWLHEGQNGCSWFVQSHFGQFVLHARRWRLTTSTDSYLIRKILRLDPEIARVLPVVYETVKGWRCVPDYEWVWSLEDWKAGKQGDDAYKAGRMLGLFHIQLAALNNPIFRSSLYKPVSEWEYDTITDGWQDVVKQALEIMPEVVRMYNSVGKRRQLSLVDFHPANVLFVGDEISAVLDFDPVWAPVCQAIAFGAYRWKNPDRFIEGYQETAGKIEPEELSWKEWYRLELGQRMAWILTVNLKYKQVAWRADLVKHLEEWRKYD
jgi:hypothetical protein